MSSDDDLDPYGYAGYAYADPAPARGGKKKKKKDPNAPKRNQSAFFLYSNANRARIKEENPDAKFGDIAKIASREFKLISADERSRWDQLAAEDKERYLAQMEDYEPPYDSDDSAPHKKKKKKKDPNAPKRNQSSFFLYSNATRNDVRAANPDAKLCDVAKIISQHYHALPEEEKAYWAEAAARDKERYLREKQSYEETGTF